ncbi:MAG TPA: C39 family peptidase [Povalibacter sp.]|uniref:C39 family peptidase n=1 Tax=Povalibacter sp. TaxID=1962978 RepID=UPI002CABE1EA|nr:C39 family peptidase [Povalibacter sp.]HMN45784.1 C39 family peptidase [Povalibacter sp.]
MKRRCTKGAWLLLALASGAQATSLDVAVAQDGSYRMRVTSLKEARFATTLRQKYDFSCGSAALATLLTFHYDRPISEQAVFAEMFQAGDRSKISKQGFSLLDMKHYLNAHGYSADGFEQPVERLAQERLPAIVLLSERGYRHFVVVKGLSRGRVLVGDPAMGTRAMSIERFKSLWVNNILFVIHNRREQARFDLAADWRIAPSSPLELSIVRDDRLDTLPVRRAGSF